MNAKKAKAIRRRRPRGSGSVYQLHRPGCLRPTRGCDCVWWIFYRGPDGCRLAESAGSHRKGDAQRLLERRIGAREHHLPVIPKVEQLTFDAAAKTLITSYEVNGKPSTPVLKRRVTKHLSPFFSGRRMAGITAADVMQYIAHRKAEGIVAWKGKRKGQRVKDVSNSEVNRELAALKFDLQPRALGRADRLDAAHRDAHRTATARGLL